MVRLVLFDIDGTLIRSGGAGVRAFTLAFSEEFGFEGADKLNFCGRTDYSLAREFFNLKGVKPTPALFDRFFDAYLCRLQRLLKESHGSVCPGIVEFMESARALPQPPVIGLLTGNIRRGAEVKLRHYQLWEQFVFGAFADDSEDRNQIAVAARKRGGDYLRRPLDGSEIVVIGDTPLDVQCGRAIGAKVLAVATGFFSVEQLAQCQPDWAVRDLNQVSVAEVCA
jgi:phosphoglycolate phosphatase